MNNKKAPGTSRGKAEGARENSIAFDSYCTPYPYPLSSNRFERAHAQPRGSLSAAQESRLITYPPALLAEHRRRLGIFQPIPRLSKRDAWRLINAISRDDGGVA